MTLQTTRSGVADQPDSVQPAEAEHRGAVHRVSPVVGAAVPGPRRPAAPAPAARAPGPAAAAAVPRGGRHRRCRRHRRHAFGAGRGDRLRRAGRVSLLLFLSLSLGGSFLTRTCGSTSSCAVPIRAQTAKFIQMRNGLWMDGHRSKISSGTIRHCAQQP